MVLYNSTTMLPSTVEYYPLQLEAELNTLLQSFKTELKNEVGRLPVAGADFSNNDLKRDLLELLVGQTDAALNGSLDEQSLNPDDYLLPNSYAGLIPAFSPYGIGKKDPKDISKLYVTDYVRANRVSPLSTVPAKGIKLTNATIEYENKVSGGNVTEADEIKVREVILTEGAECLYAIDKIKKNINHKDVKEAFPGVVDGAYYDSFGGRGQFENWSAINRARRKLIINGWAMSDITTIGRLDLIAKQEKDPKFADNNMRILFGQPNAEESFKDAVSASRGLKPLLKHISSRRDAVANGWPLSDLGLYSHFGQLSSAVEKHISSLESGGEVTAGFAGKLKEFNNFIHEKILNKPYEADPIKRADLYNEIAEKLNSITNERDRLLQTKGMSKTVRDSVKNVLSRADNVNNLSEDGGMPLAYELRSLAAEYRIEAIEAKKKNCLDEIKSVADPIVYNELRSWIRNEPPKQNHLGIDPSFVGKADIYIKSGMGELNKEIEAIRADKETTLEGKTGLKSENAVDAIRNMLDASDSIFHRDSKQYKTIKESLNKLRDGTATAEDKAKLTADVKTWLTDPGYDRIHKHLKNEFDNTRFNIMFTLVNELDPAWAKENFADMNIAGLHGEKADNTSFHNVHEFTNFMHRQMADGGFLMEVRAVESQRWYLKADSYGQKGLVEEVLRVREDTAFTDKDRLKAEQDNIGKLMKGDTGFEQKFEKLVQYHNACMTSLSGNQVALGLGGQYEEKIKNRMDKLRREAMDGLRTYINNPQNRTAPDYKKAVTAYGVMDPYAAHVFIANMRKNNPADKVIRELNLVDLEKKEGIDLGGRRALRMKKQQLRQAERVNQAVNNNNQSVNNPVLRQQS